MGLPEGHAVALSSGSAALYLALWGLHAANRKVHFPGYVCAAVRNAVTMADAKSVIVDTAPDSPNIDASGLATDADILIAPYLFGIPYRLKAVPAGVAVIEDCAQALGARIDGKPVGRQGKLAVFSFYATKMITSGGQGGMVVSQDRDMVEQIRDYRQFDCRRDRLARFNFQMTDVQAAIGRVQLARVEEFVAKREAIFRRYKRSGLDLLEADGQGLQAVRYRAVLRYGHPEKMMRRLNEAGIGSIVPIEDWELLDAPENLPNACRLSRNTVSLPIYPSLKMKEVDLIAREVAQAL